MDRPGIFLSDDHDQSSQINTETLSFTSTRSMFEKKTYGDPLEKKDEKKRSTSSISSGYTPDLLQDVIDRSPTPSSPIRSRVSTPPSGLSPTRFSTAPRNPEMDSLPSSGATSVASTLRSRAKEAESDGTG